MFVFASWKDFSITATCASDGGAWTEITEFADGAVAAGNGVGSMKVACWYFDFTVATDDDNIIITLSATPNISGAVLATLRKDTSETWDTPTFVTAGITLSSPFSVTSSSTITIVDGAMVQELVGIRDNSTTFTRDSNTALDDDGSPAVTWNGNVVESPAAHLDTTDGGDMAADRIYRLVTTGAAGVNLTATGTLSASETGSCLWVHQSVTAPAVERVPFYRPYTQLLAH